MLAQLAQAACACTQAACAYMTHQDNQLAAALLCQVAVHGQLPANHLTKAYEITQQYQYPPL